MPATVVLGNFQSAKEPIARRSFFLGMGREIKERIELYYRKMKSDKKTETYFEMGDIGTVPVFQGEIEYEGISQGYESTIPNKLYGKGLRIDYEFMRTDQQKIVEDLPRLLGVAMNRRLSGDSASWFNNMFSTAYTTRDGLALISSAHTSNQPNGPTQSNRITTAFGPLALSAARITMRKFLTNKGNVMEVLPTLIFAPIDLEDSVDEVIKTQGQVNTANNTINVHKGKWTGIFDIRFSDTNNWCIADKELMKEFQVWQTVDPVKFEQAKDFDGLTAKYRVTDFHGFGSKGWEWILGAEVD